MTGVSSEPGRVTAEPGSCPAFDAVAGPCVHDRGHPPILDGRGDSWKHATNTGVYWNDDIPPVADPAGNLALGCRLVSAPLDAVREYRAHAPARRPLQLAERAAVIRDVAALFRTGRALVPGTTEHRLRWAGAHDWLWQLADATEAEHPQGFPHRGDDLMGHTLPGRDDLVRTRQDVTEASYGGEVHNGVALVALGEDGDYWTAYGHHPPVQFAEACREYIGEDFVRPEDVRHVYAVMEHDDAFAEDDGYTVRWRGITPEDDRAFPLTLWSADEAAAGEGPSAT